VTVPITRSIWSKAAATWAVYVVTGMVSLLAAPPGSAVSQLYLAAGLGLAMVLGWGRAQALAVGLGSATVSAFALFFLGQQAMTPAAWMGIMASGVGGGLQVWVAARWLQGPEDRQPLALDTASNVVRFLVVAGPVCCLINATLSSSVMVACQMLAANEWLPTLGSWWAGDTMGVLLGTPMMLTLVGRPRRLWQQRRLVVGLPLLCAAVLLALGIRQVQSLEHQQEVAEFRQSTDAVASSARLRLNNYLTALEALRSVYEASDKVERDEFRRATSHWLSHLRGIQAMGWEERVPSGQLATFEAQQRAEGLPGYAVFDFPGRQKPRGTDIVALRFIEPRVGNELALGFNVMSREVTRRGYTLAAQTNTPVATPGFKLAQEIGQQLGVAIYRTVYERPPEPGMQPTSQPRGVVFMALRMDDAMAAVLKGTPSFLQACLFDNTDQTPTLLSGGSHCKREASIAPHLSTKVALPFAGRQWALQLQATSPVMLIGVRSTSWLFAIGGVAFAAALGALLLVITGANERMVEAVEEARQQRAAAESANQAKTDFLSRMSHELRTPLNAMLGFAQVMGIDSLNPLNKTQQARVDQIQQAGWHLLDMIDDVLDLSRIDSGTMALQTDRLALPAVLDAAATLIAPQAARQEIQVRVDNNVPYQWGVQADGTRLRQVLTNLMSNAVKYNRQGGSVHLQARLIEHPQQPQVQITVSDTGLGMSAIQLSQLFQPFNRLGRERLAPDGTGIGLVISRHLVLLMGGSLEVSSQEGQGSTFTLLLPAIALGPLAPPDAPLDETRLARPSQDRPRRHVLYVEDNDANTALVEAALSSRSWIHLRVAGTIEEGLATLHDRVHGPMPDLILLDVHLPDASGLDFLKLLKANPETAHIPVAMISADAMPEQIDACLKAGAACYLTKPLQIQALLQQTDDLLNAPALPGR
jgi:signal transduction histidine kinase/ActR/RegA family two-component response regulator